MLRLPGDLSCFALLRNLRLLEGQRPVSAGAGLRVLVAGVGSRALAGRLSRLQPSLRLESAGDGATLDAAHLAALSGAGLASVIVSQAYHSLPRGAPAFFTAARAALDAEHGALGMTWCRSLVDEVSGSRRCRRLCQRIPARPPARPSRPPFTPCAMTKTYMKFEIMRLCMRTPVHGAPRPLSFCLPAAPPPPSRHRGCAPHARLFFSPRATGADAHDRPRSPPSPAERRPASPSGAAAAARRRPARPPTSARS